MIRPIRGQIISMDAYIAVGVFLVMLIMLYAFAALKGTTTNLDQESKSISEKLISTHYLEDKGIDSYEELELSAMSCEDLMELLDTKSKKLCIYLQDNEGNAIPLDFDSKFGLGCPGINISGVPCGYSYFGNAYYLGSPFVLRNSDGENVALFSFSGDIIIKGSCTAKADCGTSPIDSVLIVENALGEDVSYLDRDGNMCIEDTTLGCHIGSPDPDCSGIFDNTFIVQSPTGNEIVSYIDSDGKLCYTGIFETNSDKLSEINN
jgi:hypothetical protein